MQSAGAGGFGIAVVNGAIQVGGAGIVAGGAASAYSDTTTEEDNRNEHGSGEKSD